MIDRDKIEKSLLMCIVRDKSWNTLLLNDVSRELFSVANKPIYDFLKEQVSKETYPDLRIVAYKFEIDDMSMSEYTSFKDLDLLCNTLKDDYARDKLFSEVTKLNEYSDEIDKNPYKYIERIGNLYNDIKSLGNHTQSVGLFDDIEQILTIDPSDVISTGFKELDDVLVGWKRGEELAVFMARTNQGKSWFGLKFAMSAAFSGERVGIYSGEMSTQQVQERALCCAKPTHQSTKEDSLAFIKEHNPYIKILTQKELRRRANVDDIEQMIVRDNLTMVVVDQLSLMEDNTSKPGTPLRQQYGNLTNDLFTLSTAYNVPIILLVQSNRGGSQEQNGPTLENIAESDAVGQNASRVISMRNDNGVLTLKIVKNRYGPVGFMQKYEVDFSLNKYKPIQDYSQELNTARQARVKQIFSGGGKPF